MTMLYLLLALNLASIVICHHIAKSRGANSLLWALLGALFGPLAIPFALMIKPGSAEE
ncbi:MAG: hypothetical protein KME56_04715 [Candidatus Thiodiazotropha sp. (ex Ctena orbiculata)]|uniref:Uncharacterized protein n=1 Tax=Candidatus Thiodiazotropha taylori TaxID=2792791 RepID=A0A944MEW8_9GAMM|nr:hypothetical protein [Candidatus Thiodiazotropha taylori]MBT2989745.1 hypothetical protein [Candidatus Thiodiazotropha taylori]MBT2995916.1 hypothetical protein [Candidatus Thiodiazotropha taylori]MBT2999231.1 hypothetical protein [Candidatus Thiodiazotropha taylori]MBT3026000.1 hypothetical protein [Candidatus Thiodiazotropha taylori]